MTKKEAIDSIFYDGQPVFRHIEEIRQHLETAISQQIDRCAASEYLKEHKFTTLADDGSTITGNMLVKEEFSTMYMLQSMLKKVNSHYRKMGWDK